MAAPHHTDEWGEVVEPFPGAIVFSPGTLRGVVAIDQTDSVGDVTVSLTVLERYSDGARLRFMVQSGEARKRKQMNLVGVQVTDDQGRRYRTALLEMSHEGSRVEGALALAPAIPRNVAHLTVSVAAVGDQKKPADAAAGPWEFPVQVVAPVNLTV